ncbi:MAG: Asp23/Gls24 family envelope stress response protein [Oscillospiraceae bacterium]|nr:Asp23/Gls24 family envelope stress response protein [Oscillospiraceae bacterium]
MITVENHIGKITVSNAYLTDLIWTTVTGCFGVTAMNSSSLPEEIASYLTRRKSKDNGVIIKVKDNNLMINLHISVTFGTNISAVINSLKHKVRFTVEEATGITVSEINISVDNIK